MSYLKEVSFYVVDKIEVSKMKVENYITTDNMLPNRGGITIAENLPKANRVTKYIPGDVLISNIRPYFKKIWYADKTGGCSNDVIVFRSNSNISNPKFLYYVLSQSCFFDYMMSGANGTKMPRGNKKTIPDFVIPTFTADIQDRIVDILSAYDDLIKNNQKQILLLEEAAQRLYKEWFIDLHFPAYEDVKIVDGVPEGWKKETLKNVLCKITTGLNPRKNFELGKGNNYYVTIKNMGDNTVYLDDKCDKVDNQALEKINKRSDLREGDILFSGIGTMGRVCLVAISTENWNVSESVFTLRANEKISKELLFLILLSDDMKGYCDTHAHGVAQRGIRMEDLKEYPILLPKAEIIESFTYNVKPIIDKTQMLRKQIFLLKEARDLLLPKLMSGEIEV